MSILELRTYEEWRDDGYQVMKGEEAYEHNDEGKALFTEEQVYEL